MARAAAARCQGQGEERALPAGIVTGPPTPPNHPHRAPTTPTERPQAVAEGDPAALPELDNARRPAALPELMNTT